MHAREQGAGMKARKRPGMALSLTGLFRKEIGYVASGTFRVFRYGLQGPPGVVAIIVSLQYQAENGTITGSLGTVEPSNLVRHCSWPGFRVIISFTIFVEPRTVPLASSNESVMSFVLTCMSTKSRPTALARFPLAVAANRSFGYSVRRAVLLDRPP